MSTAFLSLFPAPICAILTSHNILPQDGRYLPYDERIPTYVKSRHGPLGDPRGLCLCPGESCGSGRGERGRFFHRQSQRPRPGHGGRGRPQTGGRHRPHQAPWLHPCPGRRPGPPGPGRGLKPPLRHELHRRQLLSHRRCRRRPVLRPVRPVLPRRYLYCVCAVFSGV